MPVNGKSIPPLFSSSDIGPSSLTVLNASLNNTLLPAVPGNALNNKARIANECSMGSIDECSRRFPSVTNLRTEHALPAKTGEETILTNLLHNLHQFPAQPSSAASTSSADSVDAYPLVKDQDPTDTSEVPPEVKMPHTKQLTPTSIMVVDTILTIRSRVLLKVLFHPGSTATLISHKCLP